MGNLDLRPAGAVEAGGIPSLALANVVRVDLESPARVDFGRGAGACFRRPCPRSANPANVSDETDPENKRQEETVISHRLQMHSFASHGFTRVAINSILYQSLVAKVRIIIITESSINGSVIV